MSHELGPRSVVACFVAATGISAAGAILLGPQTAGTSVFVLGVLFIAAAIVLDHIASLSEVEK